MPSKKKQGASLETLAAIIGILSGVAGIYDKNPLLGIIAMVIAGFGLLAYWGGKPSNRTAVSIASILLGIAVGVAAFFVGIAGPDLTLSVFVDANENSRRDGLEMAADPGLEVTVFDETGTSYTRYTNDKSEVAFHDFPRGAISVHVGENAPFDRRVSWYKRSVKIGLPPSPGDVDEPDETQTPIPQSTDFTYRLSTRDGMEQVYISSGTFPMGLSGGRDNPQHEVYLDAYWMDRTEVTNGMYAKCVAAGDCSPTGESATTSGRQYYGNAVYDGYPVTQVSWLQARDYCAWAGRSLPTEAQWEKAARGADEHRSFPWGGASQLPDDQKVNIGNYYGDTLPVTQYLQDVSYYGIYGLGGNVQEWVWDWYDSNYYQENGRLENPKGPLSGTQRVLRGSAWDSVEDPNTAARIDVRYSAPPETQNHTIGFRCVESDE